MSTTILSRMEKSTERTSKADKTSMRYWAGAVVPAELSDFQHLLTELLRGEGRQGLKFERLRTAQKNIVLYSVRINQAARLLLTEQEKNGDRILVAVALTNHYKGWEKNQRCTQKLSAYLRRLGLAPEAFETVTTEPVPEVEQKRLEAILTTESPQKAIYFSGDFLCLKDDQKNASQMRLPGLLIGMPGTGKTVAGVECLRALHETNANATFYFSSSIGALVQEVSETWAVEHPGKSTHFLPFLTLLGQFFDLRRYADKTPCQIDAFRMYIKQQQTAFTQKRKTNRNTPEPLLLAMVAKKPVEKIYELFQLLALYELLPKTELLHYLSDNITFNESVSIGQLQALLIEYRKHLDKTNAYDLGMMPPPASHQTHTDAILVIDEVQNIPPALLFCLQQVFGDRILGIGDPHQALCAQPMELLWRCLWPEYRMEKLNQSLRCPAPVVRMAQSVLGLLHVVGGAQVKGYCGYAQVPEPEHQLLAPLFAPLPKTYTLLEHGALHVVVAKRDQLALAEKLYADVTPFIHCLEDVGGLTFKNVLLYGFWEHSTWKTLTEADYAKAKQAQVGNLSKVPASRLDVETWLRQFLVAISRCTDKLWLGAPPKCQQATAFLAYFGVQEASSKPSQELPCAVTEPTLVQARPCDDFEVIRKEIEQLLQQGLDIREAERMVMLAQKKGLQKSQYNLLNQLIARAKEAARQSLVTPLPLRLQTGEKAQSDFYLLAWQTLQSATMVDEPVLSCLQQLLTPEHLHALQKRASEAQAPVAQKLLGLLVDQYAYVDVKADERKADVGKLWFQMLLHGSWPARHEEQSQFNSRLLLNILGHKEPSDALNLVGKIFCFPRPEFWQLIKNLPLLELQTRFGCFSDDIIRKILLDNPIGLYHFFARFQRSAHSHHVLTHFLKRLPKEQDVVDKLEESLLLEPPRSLAYGILTMLKGADRLPAELVEQFKYFPSWLGDVQLFGVFETLINRILPESKPRELLEDFLLLHPGLLLEEHIQKWFVSAFSGASQHFKRQFPTVLSKRPALARALWPMLLREVLANMHKALHHMLYLPLEKTRSSSQTELFLSLLWLDKAISITPKLGLDETHLQTLKQSIQALHRVLLNDDALSTEHKQALLQFVLKPQGNMGSLLYYWLALISLYNTVPSMREAQGYIVTLFEQVTTRRSPDEAAVFLPHWFNVFRQYEKNRVLGVSELFLLENRFRSKLSDAFWLSCFSSTEPAYTDVLSAMGLAFFEKFLPMLRENEALWNAFLQTRSAVFGVCKRLYDAPCIVIETLEKKIPELRQILEKSREAIEEEALSSMTEEQLLCKYLYKYKETNTSTTTQHQILRLWLSDAHNDTVLNMLCYLRAERSLEGSKTYRALSEKIWTILFQNLATNIGRQEAPCFVWEKLLQKVVDKTPDGREMERLLQTHMLLSSWSSAEGNETMQSTFAEYLHSLPQQQRISILEKFQSNSINDALMLANLKNLSMACSKALKQLHYEKTLQELGVRVSKSGLYALPVSPQREEPKQDNRVHFSM